LAGLGSGTARLTETILLTPDNLTALATARRAISRHPPRRPLKITFAPKITPVAPRPPPPSTRDKLALSDLLARFWCEWAQSAGNAGPVM